MKYPTPLQSIITSVGFFSTSFPCMCVIIKLLISLSKILNKMAYKSFYNSIYSFNVETFLLLSINYSYSCHINNFINTCSQLKNVNRLTHTHHYWTNRICFIQFLKELIRNIGRINVGKIKVFTFLPANFENGKVS